jgi:AraC family transcriptional regulator of adaptative response/methylated-DNA-[protein]-cysteine methyltransferase
MVIHRKNRVAGGTRRTENKAMNTEASSTTRAKTGSDYHRIAEAIRFIEANVEGQPRLDDVAAHLGLSPFHTQRLFLRWAGVSPKDFLQHLTLGRAKSELLASASLLDASHAVGLSGPGRLHDLFLGLEAMTPGEFKRGAEGVTIAWAIHPTPFGDALFGATARGLAALTFVDADDDAESRAVADLAARWPHATLREDAVFTRPYADEVARRMRGEVGAPLALVLKGTPFQVQVWRALLEVPEGRVTTYGDLATRLEIGGASRAIGNACGQNPIAFLIPCHRVLRATGAVGDYRWDPLRKRALLAAEAARVRARAS